MLGNKLMPFVTLLFNIKQEFEEIVVSSVSFIWSRITYCIIHHMATGVYSKHKVGLFFKWVFKDSVVVEKTFANLDSF